MEVLIETSEGDMRKAITSLQSACRLKGSDDIRALDIYEINGVCMHLKVTSVVIGPDVTPFIEIHSVHVLTDCSKKYHDSAV